MFSVKQNTSLAKKKPYPVTPNRVLDFAFHGGSYVLHYDKTARDAFDVYAIKNFWAGEKLLHVPHMMDVPFDTYFPANNPKVR